jgi:hypothetical protein
MRDETGAAIGQAVQFIFDQRLELPPDQHARQPRVARLLEPFDQQRPVGSLREHVRVEVVAFHTRRIRQDDLAHPERRELSPEAPQHLRPRQRQQEIDRRPRRHHLLEPAPQLGPFVIDRHDRPASAGSIDDTHAHLVADRHAQHLPQMHGAHAGHRDRARIAYFVWLEQDQIHDRSRPSH